MTKLAALALVALLTMSALAAPAAAKGKGGNSSSAKLCQKGGWQEVWTADGDPFTSEKACTSYAARGGTLSQTPYPEAAATCESLTDGTLLVINETIRFEYQLWRCEWVDEEGNRAGFEPLFAACETSGGRSLYDTPTTLPEKQWAVICGVSVG